MPQTTMKAITYNASLGAFEARVDIRRGNKTFRYPCAVAGPLTMKPGVVRSRLLQQAARMSDSGTSLRSAL